MFNWERDQFGDRGVNERFVLRNVFWRNALQSYESVPTGWKEPNCINFLREKEYVNDPYFVLHYNFPCFYSICVARGYSTY